MGTGPIVEMGTGPIVATPQIWAFSVASKNGDRAHFELCRNGDRPHFFDAANFGLSAAFGQMGTGLISPAGRLPAWFVERDRRRQRWPKLLLKKPSSGDTTSTRRSPTRGRSRGTSCSTFPPPRCEAAALGWMPRCIPTRASKASSITITFRSKSISKNSRKRSSALARSGRRPSR